MKVMIASDFFYEWELYEADDLNRFKQYAKNLLNNKENLTEYRIIGSQDTMELSEAQEQADKIIYTSELMDDREEQRL